MSDLTDKLQAKREVLRHYTDVLRETREAMGVPLDVALAANGLCESLATNYRATTEAMDLERDEYAQWLKRIDGFNDELPDREESRHQEENNL